MRRGLTMVMATAALAGSLAACGSSSGGTPQATLKTFLGALAKGNGSTACAQVTSSQQKAIASAATSAGLKNASCKTVIAALSKELTASDKSKLTNVKFKSVKISGNTATATFVGGTGTASLTKTGGKWMISGGLSG